MVKIGRPKASYISATYLGTDVKVPFTIDTPIIFEKFHEFNRYRPALILSLPQSPLPVRVELSQLSVFVLELYCTIFKKLPPNQQPYECNELATALQRVGFVANFVDGALYLGKYGTAKESESAYMEAIENLSPY